jgi:hypothetical protein
VKGRRQTFLNSRKNAKTVFIRLTLMDCLFGGKCLIRMPLGSTVFSMVQSRIRTTGIAGKSLVPMTLEGAVHDLFIGSVPQKV